MKLDSHYRKIIMNSPLKEFISVPEDKYFLPYSSEMSDMADVLGDVAFNAKQLQECAEEYAAVSDDEVFTKDSIMQDYYEDLMKSIEKLEQFKDIMQKVMELREKNSDDSDE